MQILGLGKVIIMRFSGRKGEIGGVYTIFFDVMFAYIKKYL